MKKIFTSLLLLFLMAGFAAAEDFDFYVNFHRGGGNEKPENTLETFLWCWNLGVIPEGDVQYTKDGVPVMFHDSNINRMVWQVPEELKGKKIADFTWDEIRKFDVGSHRGPSTPTSTFRRWSRFSARWPISRSVFSTSTKKV